MPPSNHSPRLLLIEDDTSIQLGLRMNLERQGYEVEVATDGATGLERLREGGWALCILDIMLPQLNGYEALQRMKSEGLDTPIVVLSARSGDDDKVIGLDLGAEDYVTKPFSVPELLARVRVVLRRQRAPQGQGGPEEQRFHFGEVLLDAATREVTRDGEHVDLTVTEFDILTALAKAGGEALSRDRIFEAVWGEGHHGTRRTIDNFIAQLRHKLEDDPANPSHLLTVRGVGYRLVA